jgi:FkbM family methyltransferase
VSDLPEHIIAVNKYGRYCVPTASAWRPAAKAVLEGEVWERKTLSFMHKNAGHGDIVHAGAYFGDFLPALSKALFGSAHLWAFEPSSQNYACARRTLELNELKNVTLMHAGLGAAAGTQTFKTGRESEPSLGGASRAVKHRRPGGAYEEVAIVAVDDVVPGERLVSIIQLDVEGFELEALMGAVKTIRGSKPILILESRPKNEDWFAREILSLGYAETGKVHGNKVFEVTR